MEISAISGLLVIASCMAYYELMYFIWHMVDNIKLPHRLKMFLVLVCIFFVHIVTVLVYGGLYYWMMRHDYGYLFHTSTQAHVHDLSEYIYFSVVTYSSLGMDDVLPSGRVRFLSGAEVLNGMVLIAWSASYTYISMEKFWHVRKNK